MPFIGNYNLFHDGRSAKQGSAIIATNEKTIKCIQMTMFNKDSFIKIQFNS